MSDQFCEECGQEPQCAEGFGRCPSCHARNEIAALRKENEELKAELSAYKEGIPVEDADKGKDFLAHEYEDYFVVCAHHGDDKGWRYYNDRSDMFEEVNSDRLYPLPHQQKEES